MQGDIVLRMNLSIRMKSRRNFSNDENVASVNLHLSVHFNSWVTIKEISAFSAFLLATAFSMFFTGFESKCLWGHLFAVLPRNFELLQQ